MDEIEKKEEWYLNIDYREAKEIIRNKLQGMTQNFIGIGFYLRQIKETEGFRKDGYESIYEFAEDQYGIKRSTAIRWMQMNEKFSQGGYSPCILAVIVVWQPIWTMNCMRNGWMVILNMDLILKHGNE